MRIYILILLSVLGFNCLAQEEEIDFEEYSYTEFFQMIADEQDSVFELRHALITYSQERDSAYGSKYLRSTEEEGSIRTFTRKDTVFIDKIIHLEDVHFLNSPPETSDTTSGSFSLMRFSKQFTLHNCLGFAAHHSSFDAPVTVTYSDSLKASYSGIQTHVLSINIENSIFHKGLEIGPKSAITEKLDYDVFLSYCHIYSGNSKYYHSLIESNNISYLGLDHNRFHEKGIVILDFEKSPNIWVKYNEFYDQYVNLSGAMAARDQANLQEIMNNEFRKPTFLMLKFDENLGVDWDQFEGGIVDGLAFFLEYNKALDYQLDRENYDTDYPSYQDSFRVINQYAYNAELKLRGKFLDHFKGEHNTDVANKIFIEIKDLETQRLGHLYLNDPTFRAYFRWRINQFLRLFADYGTDPSKAIVFAVYVIAFFAAIYLFFPNSWDGHGRMRIMDRYRFFLKYINRQEGASEVYMEEKNKELLPFHEFKQYLEEQGKTAPKFFYVTALPLYKWSVSGSRLSGWLLSKVDVLKGTWLDVPKNGRWLKSTLVIGAFLVALFYDLFIKVLNAVMLSINTFTTLGFGEIPIKGLPRYLAIIQGFIGWFMLTIFSVSLISQLLN